MNTDSLHILVIEDDPKLAHTITKSLREKAYNVTRCGTGEDAIAHFEDAHVDLAILDLGLPDMDGMDILAHIRSKSPNVPVLILTARDAVADRVAGLDGGADDYLVKPISLSELQARIRALARRITLGRQSALACEDLTLDITSRTSTRAGDVLELSPREFDLLQYLLEHRGEVVTRSMLARDVWKYNSRATPIDNIVDVQMSRLREKVDKPYEVSLIKTVRGVGFTLGAT